MYTLRVYIYDLAGFSVVGMGYVNGFKYDAIILQLQWIYTLVCEGLII